MMMKLRTIIYLFILIAALTMSCNYQNKPKKPMQPQITMTAKMLLGNPKYLAISYGGYRKTTRDIQPTINEIKDDLKILSAMGIKILRTYNVQLNQASNILQAISEMKKEDSDFEMYVMLGAWIDCENAWTDEAPNHEVGSSQNEGEIKRAVSLTKQYPDIVKIVAVGNEAMVHWATSYFVRPKIILKWVNYLQELKKSGDLPKDLWITSSDNFASWGGGDKVYHTNDLEKLIKAVDYISMHTYPFHDTHYNQNFWVNDTINRINDIEKIQAAMQRAKHYAISQYQGVKLYVESLGIVKSIHIGESGWATYSNGLYGSNGSKATDEYKSGLYYKYLREWTRQEGLTCFYFEAFDEIWKDSENPQGSENHFGLITIDGQVKYALWDLVDQDIFKGLSRNGQLLTKTHNGNKSELMKEVLVPSINVSNR